MDNPIEWITFWIVVGGFGSWLAAWPISWILIQVNKERAAIWVLGGGFVSIVPAVVAVAAGTIAKAAGWF